MWINSLGGGGGESRLLSYEHQIEQGQTKSTKPEKPARSRLFSDFIRFQQARGLNIIRDYLYQNVLAKRMVS